MLFRSPTPIAPPIGVISLFSDAYPNYPVENWRAFGSQAVGYQQLPVAGNNTKLYTGLANGFVGISFSRPPVDASAMTYFHLDVWLVSGMTFKVKLVDFGPDGVSNFPSAGDDTQSELTFSDVSTPPIATGSWLSLDIPLTNFTALANPARHVAQLVLSGDTPIVFVDNIYFHSSSE